MPITAESIMQCILKLEKQNNVTVLTMILQRCSSDQVYDMSFSYIGNVSKVWLLISEYLLVLDVDLFQLEFQWSVQMARINAKVVNSGEKIGHLASTSFKRLKKSLGKIFAFSNLMSY